MNHNTLNFISTFDGTATHLRQDSRQATITEGWTVATPGGASIGSLPPTDVGPAAAAVAAWYEWSVCGVM